MLRQVVVLIHQGLPVKGCIAFAIYCLFYSTLSEPPARLAYGLCSLVRDVREPAVGVLLYTSDASDEERGVDSGFRLVSKKKLQWK